MAKEGKEKKAIEKAYKAMNDYMALSKLFFAGDGLENFNQIPNDSPFYEDAQDLVKEFDMKWDKLNAEDSDELMLAMLQDYYNRIKVDDEFQYILNIKVQQLEKKEAD